MKKLYIFALVAAMFAACATDAIEEQSVKIEPQTPDTLIGTFEDDDSRIQLQNGKTVWTNGDLVSVFYRSNANQKWQYQGETGERTGNLKRVANAEGTQELSNIVVVYPYNENYYINPKTSNVQASLPATQTYLKDSYGLDGNIMISQSEYNQFSLKNVCGWLKIQLTGNGEKVQSITLRGNNGEQVAGEIYINSADATSSLAADMGGADDNENGAGGNLVFDDTILTEVTLNCGEGVALGSTAKSFYIALPPQSFEKGLTINIACTDGSTMTKTTTNAITIARNAILPMAEIKYEGVKPQPNNEIWYTATEKTEPYDKTVFGANYLCNHWDPTTGIGIISFDGDVTKIGKAAFYNRSFLTSISFPNSTTSIGQDAFVTCKNLESVSISNGIISIGETAFYGCNNLTKVYYYGELSKWCNINFSSHSSNPLSYGASLYINDVIITEVTIPSDITKIGLIFTGCTSITKVITHNRITEISYCAFDGCNNLVSISIPNSITKIGHSAFKNCSRLTSVTIPNGITEILLSTFSGCSSLTSVVIPDSVTSIEKSAFKNCSSLTSVNIPDSVTSIGDEAFYGCCSLISVAIPNSVNLVGDYAFGFCSGELIVNNKFLVETNFTASYSISNWLSSSSFTKLTIGIDIERIGNYAFDELWSLTSVNIPDSVTSIGSYAFYDCTSLTSVTIGNSVTSIGSSAFRYCTSLTSVTIPNSVTSIGDEAFYYCPSLTSVTIGDSVTEIGNYAFYQCTSLKSIIIPDSVTEIGQSAFSWCTSLTSVTIGNGVTSIGEDAFFWCTSLKEVYCKPTTPPAGGSNMFDSNASGRKIFVPAASVEAYKTAEYWKDYASYFVGYEF